MILKFNPDVVILDLRLIENDHKREEITSFTGIKIRDMIKEINPAIQVIMFTATSKSRILEELYQHNILGYIKKEDPQERNIKTKESFAKLAELVDKGLGKKWLKEIWDIQENILTLQIFEQEDENFVKIKAEIETIFEILNSDLENKIKFTILTLFKVLEILTDIYYQGNKNDGAYTKIFSLTKNLNLAINPHTISQLVCTRNFLVHSGEIKPICEYKVVEKPTQEHILTWFKMLQTILEKIDKSSK